MWYVPFVGIDNVFYTAVYGGAGGYISRRHLHKQQYLLCHVLDFAIVYALLEQADFL